MTVKEALCSDTPEPSDAVGKVRNAWYELKLKERGFTPAYPVVEAVEESKVPADAASDTV